MLLWPSSSTHSHLNVLGAIDEGRGALEDASGNGLGCVSCSSLRQRGQLTEKARCQVVRKTG